MYDYPAEGTPFGVRVVRLRRPTPCRQSSTTALGRGAQTALLDGQPACGNTPRLNSEGAASFASRTSPL
jgi:hypothetical protein